MSLQEALRARALNLRHTRLAAQTRPGPHRCMREAPVLEQGIHLRPTSRCGRGTAPTPATHRAQSLISSLLRATIWLLLTFAEELKLQ